MDEPLARPDAFVTRAELMKTFETLLPDLFARFIALERRLKAMESRPTGAGGVTLIANGEVQLTSPGLPEVAAAIEMLKETMLAPVTPEYDPATGRLIAARRKVP